MKEVLNEFEQALRKFEIDQAALPDQSIRDRIQQYCVLLWHKNQQLNLTRHTDWEPFVSRDLVDTLELSKLIPEEKEVLDVGSGGGVPGLLLAIIRPDLEISLAESVGKRAVVLAEFADLLGLSCQIYQERAENILKDFRFDITTARAVGSLSKLCTWFQDDWLHVGRLLAIKGPNWVNERQEAEDAGLLEQVDLQSLVEYQPVGCEWKSIILEIKKAIDD